MDEALDAKLRTILAEQAAAKYIIDYLLNHLWLELPRARRLEMADAILKASENTEHLSGVAEGDEAFAERLADMTVQMQHSIDQYVGRALKKTAEVEEAVAAKRLEER